MAFKSSLTERTSTTAKYEAMMSQKYALKPAEPKFVVSASSDFAQIEDIRNEYRALFAAFVIALGEEKDESVKSLTFRLDFNEFYEKSKKKFVQ